MPGSHRKCMDFKISYLIIFISAITWKLGEVTVDTHTYKYYNIQVTIGKSHVCGKKIRLINSA